MIDIIIASREVIMVQKIKEAMEKVDVLVTTGSVSMGDRDIMKPILQKYFKAVIHFGAVSFFLFNDISIYQNIYFLKY
jgi:gephyrin